MRLRPCIDIHNGKVKQIVGGTLSDEGDYAKENFVSEKDAAYFASLFKRDGLAGGHVILLNSKTSPYYEATRAEAFSALRAYPGGLMAGGGITDETAAEYLAAGASHVIVTSFVFKNGRIDREALKRLKEAVGREHLALDLSCKKKPAGGPYYIMTDRWQVYTETPLTADLLEELSGECDEFLIHGIDAEGKSAGPSDELIALLDSIRGFPITYAGGISGFSDLDRIRSMTGGSMDVTIGSALSIYGGRLDYRAVVDYCKQTPSLL